MYLFNSNFSLYYHEDKILGHYNKDKTNNNFLLAQQRFNVMSVNNKEPKLILSNIS